MAQQKNNCLHADIEATLSKLDGLPVIDNILLLEPVNPLNKWPSRKYPAEFPQIIDPDTAGDRHE